MFRDASHLCIFWPNCTFGPESHYKENVVRATILGLYGKSIWLDQAKPLGWERWQKKVGMRATSLLDAAELYDWARTGRLGKDPCLGKIGVRATMLP